MSSSDCSVMLLAFLVRTGNPIRSLLASQSHQACAGAERIGEMFIPVCVSWGLPSPFLHSFGAFGCVSRWNTKQQFNNIFLAVTYFMAFRHFNMWKEFSVMAHWQAGEQHPVRVVLGVCSRAVMHICPQQQLNSTCFIDLLKSKPFTKQL